MLYYNDFILVNKKRFLAFNSNKVELGNSNFFNTNKNKRYYHGFHIRKIIKNMLTFTNKSDENISMLTKTPQIFNNKNLFVNKFLNFWNKKKDNMTIYKAKLLENRNINKQLFLANPKAKPLIVENVSGLMVPRPSFYASELESKIMLVKAAIKFVVDILGLNINIYDVEELALRISNNFSYNNVLNFKDDNFFTIYQHIVNSILPFIEIPPGILNNINPLINYMAYKNTWVGIQPVIEASVIKKIYGLFMEENKDIKVIAQNHENKKGDHIEYVNECYKQMQQPHADYRLEFISKITKFIDIKLKTKPYENIKLYKGYDSLCIQLNTEIYINKLITDLTSIIKQKKKEKAITDKEFTLLSDYIQDLKNLLKESISMDQKLTLLQKLQNDIDANPDIKTIVCSRIIIDISENIALENVIYYMQEKKLIEQIAKQLPPLEDLFPKDGKTINVLAWKKVLQITIDNMPPELKEFILENKERFDLLQ